MRRSKFFISIFVLLLFSMSGNLVQASTERDSDRIVYHWVLAQWKDNEQVCRIDIDHEGLPTGQEIISQCGYEIYDLFFLTPPCDYYETGTIENCEGLYLKQIQSSMEWTSQEYLDPVLLSFGFPECDATVSGFYCQEFPRMVVNVVEDYSEGLIIEVEDGLDDEGIVCDGVTCRINLFSSGEYGTNLRIIIADKDTENHYEQNFKIQSLLMEEDEDSLKPEGWWVQVRSQHRLEKVDIKQIWGLEAPVEPPKWLALPDGAEKLETKISYYHLAGRMITYGLVSPGTCPSKGLTIDGYANECGLSAVYKGMVEWQNQFDNAIYYAADIADISPVMLKNLFAKESQFWPENDLIEFEYGFGHMTLVGADNLFMWNYNFFDRYCVMKFGYKAGCGFGYTALSEEQREELIDELLTEVSVFCEDCDTLIDYSKVNFSIEIFSEVLLAYATQSSNVIESITQEPASTLSSYEDLWRFTLANYNGGPGCITEAIEAAWESDEVLTWENVSLNFTEGCNRVIDYVEDIAPEIENPD